MEFEATRLRSEIENLSATLARCDSEIRQGTKPDEVLAYRDKETGKTVAELMNEREGKKQKLYELDKKNSTK